MLGHFDSSVEENGLFFVRSGPHKPPPYLSAWLNAVRSGPHKPPVSCELVPAVPSPPPCQLHRNNRPRSHPLHFASTAPPTLPHLSRAKCRGVSPSPPFILT